MIISWDDTDGWYDHVTGPVINQTAFNVGTNNGTLLGGATAAGGKLLSKKCRQFR